MPYVKEPSQANLKPDLPLLRAGQTVRVHQKIKEVSPEGKVKERVQVFEGQVIAVKHGRGLNATFTVRRIASGVGVERVFPMHSPTIAKIEVAKNARAKKAKLYYARRGKEVKVISLEQ